ncbi:hypothetical protein RHMOL_Rhmol06G0178700 [Rhododendron molle]|uniref:Uncharacterized protein n=1 Tax=Rhododendron molle TaxID=49168 RepID=A0ACC0NEL2_RHOML|nr:hypothetical protein RHMOL_Rhmol06G0178700 [Rhododendron molle]
MSFQICGEMVAKKIFKKATTDAYPGKHQCMMNYSVILSPLPNQNSQALPQTCLTFYGPKALQIHLVPTVDADEFYQREVDVEPISRSPGV